MPTPFFSVLLPTKNRAGLLPYAVRSLCDQTFRDFEVIIADNDDGTDTAMMVHVGLAPLLDARFRYIRTGGLWMSDNWEAALAQARGAWVYVLEDKAVLHPRAFELLAAAIEHHNPRALVFHQNQHPPPAAVAVAQAAGVVQGYAALPEAPPEIGHVSSARILDGFLERGWQPLHDDGPRSINSVAERALIEQIQAGSGRGRFFLPFAPDVTSNLLQLDLIEGVARVNLQLVSFAVNAELSAGWRFRTRLAHGFEIMFAAGGPNIAHFQRMPLGYLGVLHNHLYAEFLNLRDHAQGRLRGRRLSLERYFARIAEDLDELERFGEDVAPLRALARATRDRLGPGEL